MKDYIFYRLQQAERNIHSELDRIKRWDIKAHKLDYPSVIERVMEPLQIKSMPGRWKDQTLAILGFCWQREIANEFRFPVPYKGKLYSKWDNFPKELKEMCLKGTDPDRVRVFSWHYEEGMSWDILD